MKTPILLIVSLAALTLGFALGFSTSPIGAESSTQVASPQSSEAAGDGKMPSEFGALPSGLSNDERIVRVFSSLQQKVELRRKHALFEALQGLNSKDMAALIRHAESLKNSASAELLPALLERWFALDSASAVEWMKATKLEFNLVQIWAKADPESAIAHALASPNEQWGSSLIQQALAALYEKDPARRFARAQALPLGQLRETGVFQALATWASQDPAAAFTAFEKNEFGGSRNHLLETLLNYGATKDPDWALAKVAEILPTLKSGVLGNEFVNRLASQIAQKNPQQALEWLSGLPEEFRSSALVKAGKEWAQKEPVAALKWCLEKGVEITRADWNGTSNWQPSILGDIMENAGQETYDTIAALPPGTQRDSLLECAFMESMWHTPPKELYADGDAMALGFYKQLPADAQMAKAYLFGQKRAEFGEIADIGAWAQSFPAGLARTNAIAGAMFATQQRRASAVDDQLTKMPTGADRDAALRGIATAQPSPAGAQRALTIADETVRRDTLEKIVTRWQKADAQASRAWLQSAAIPNDWRDAWSNQSNQ